MARLRASAVTAGVLALTAGALVAPPTAAGAAPSTLFHPYETYAPLSAGESVAFGDVTGDGRDDVVMTTRSDPDPEVAYSLWVYAQGSDGMLGAPTRLPLRTTYGTGRLAVGVADLDGDTDLDAAVATPGGVEIYQQDGGGLAYAWTSLPQGAHSLELADVSGDGLADLVVNTEAGIEVYWQIGGDTMGSPMGRRLSSGLATEVEVGDVTGDGLADIVSAVGGSIEVRAQRPDHSFAAPAVYASGGLDGWTRVEGIALGDTNGDGLADVHASVGGNSPNAWVVTRLQEQDGTLGWPLLQTSYDMPESIEVADVTGDGFDDLVVVHGGFNRVGVFDSTPGTAHTETLYPVPYASHYNVKGLAVGDVTGDGRADVALGDYNHGLVLLRGAAQDGDGTPPDTTITSGPTGTIRSTTATFEFTGSPTPARYECSMDTAAWTSCTSPVTYPDLALGRDYTFRVRGVSADGLVDITPATRSFTVDRAGDVGVTLTATPSQVRRGQALTYTAQVTSYGPDAAEGVVLTQRLPQGVSIVSATATADAPVTSAGACTVAGSTVRCDLGNMTPGLGWTVTIDTTVDGAKGTLSSTAEVTTLTWDLYQGNDTATATSKVGGKGR